MNVSVRVRVKVRVSGKGRVWGRFMVAIEARNKAELLTR